MRKEYIPPMSQPMQHQAPIHDFDPPKNAAMLGSASPEDREAAAELAARAMTREGRAFAEGVAGSAAPTEWTGWEDPARWRIGDTFVCDAYWVTPTRVRLTRIA